jgi:hypothetical protein
MKQKQNQQKVEAQQARKPHIMTVVKRGRIQSVVIPEDFTVEVKFMPNYGIFTIYDNEHKVVVSTRYLVLEDIILHDLSSCSEEVCAEFTSAVSIILSCRIKFDYVTPGAHHDLTAYIEAAYATCYSLLSGKER